jgi:hypothetical protein
MPGVDFVISALFETSGLRWEGDWATALFAARASTTEAIAERIKYLTALILLRSRECKAAKIAAATRTPKRGRRCERRVRACVLECGGVPPL